jgi:type I restriction enzyme S subunit
MASEWPEQWTRARLGEVADVNWGDTSVTKASYSETGFRAYSASGPDGFLPYADFERTGVVLSAIGADCGKTWLAKGKWSCIKNTLRFWAASPDVDTAFLYWLTRDPAVWPKRGSAQPFISQGDARALEVAYPPLAEQRAIAHILGTLDDKIELNRRMSETLEQMARALFKSWFVDFEPVRAKMEGRWRRGESLPGLPAHLYDLFPDCLVESELGEIPEGWEMQPLSEVLTITGGGTPKTSVEEYWGGDIPWFSVVDTPSASDVFVVATEKSITKKGLASSSARLIPKGTTIISARGTVGNLAIAGREMTFNQSCYGLRGTGYAGDYFVYLTAQRMVDQLKSMAHGSVFSTITRQTFEAIQRPVPQPAVLTAFEGLVAPWFEAILANVEQSRTLAALRDTLLPKLISGELRVKDAERFLKERGL